MCRRRVVFRPLLGTTNVSPLVNDAGGGSVREATRYTAETVAYQKEFKASDMGEKALSGFSKDMVKSGVRSGTKMDESTAALNRARLVNAVQTTQAAMTKATDGIQTGIRNLYTPPILR